MFKYSFLFLAVIMFACKKDEIKAPEITTFAVVTTPGSYWIYDVYSIDSLGNETKFNYQDTVFLTGDTLINANEYMQFEGKNFGTNLNYAIRDSAGYIIRSDGTIIMSYVNYSDTLATGSEGGLNTNFFIMTDEGTTNITVPAGSFEAYRSPMTFYRSDGTDFTPCNHTHSFEHYYVSGLGTIISQTAFHFHLTSSCTYMERRLVDYHIAQ